MQALPEGGARPPSDAPVLHSWFDWLAQISPALIWAIDADGELRYINPTLRDFLGISDAQPGRIDWKTVMHPDDYEAYSRAFREAVAQRRPFEGRARSRNAAGEWRHFTTRAAPYYLDDGRYGGYIGMGTDDSEGERTQSALQRSERNYSTLFDSIGQGFCVIEMKFSDSGAAEDYRFLEVNPAFSTITGIPHAVGRWMRNIAPSHEQFWFDMYGRIALTGEPAQFVSFAQALERWYEVYAYRIGEPGERQVGILFNDITERKQHENDLREAGRRKDEFIATLAHELRNPLAPIRNSIELIKHPKVSLEQARATAAVMERQMKHLVRLVDDLLDVSRVSRGKLALRMERMDLALCVHDAIEMCLPRAESGRHRLIPELPARVVPLIGDRDRITQVVVNLLNNAIKFSPQGGDIRISLSVEAQRARVCVTDQGTGIAPELLPRVFDMFTQGNGSHMPREGLGIGLTLVKLLVEMHGGSVGARSEGQDKGSEVFFTLPLAAPET